MYQSVAHLAFGSPVLQENNVAAARTVQRYFNKIASQKLMLNRTALINRLRLEMNVMLGVRILCISLALFFIITAAAALDLRPQTAYNLREALKSSFALDTLSGIKTLDGFKDFYRDLSVSSRNAQVFSSPHYTDTQGIIKLAAGLQTYTTPFTRNDAVNPILAGSFTLTAWSQFDDTLTAARGANVVRKPLGVSPEENQLSCWGWRIGTSPRLIYGAHDYRGGTPGVHQESVGPDYGTDWVDGSLTFEAIVVNQTDAIFYLGKGSTGGVVERGRVRLLRPVTDCDANLLEAGDAGPAQMGEVTYYARALTISELREVLDTGFVFRDLVAGRTPYYVPPSEIDTINTQIYSGDVRTSSDRNTLTSTVNVDEVLTRGTISRIGVTPPAGTASMTFAGTPCTSPHPPTCYTLRNITATLTTDASPSTPTPYYALLRNAAISTTGEATGRMHFNGISTAFPVQFPHFEPDSFPRCAARRPPYTRAALRRPRLPRLRVPPCAPIELGRPV